MLISAINAVAEKYQLPIIFSTHPRTQKRLIESGLKMHSLVKNIKPLGFIDYVKLQENAFFVLSDSGTLTEESAMRQFPAILIRTSTERPEGVEAGSIIVSGIDKENILFSIETELMRYQFAKIPENYDVSNVSERIVRYIKDKIDLVNKKIWRK